jgi:hypothetical protein
MSVALSNKTFLVYLIWTWLLGKMSVIQLKYIFIEKYANCDSTKVSFTAKLTGLQLLKFSSMEMQHIFLQDKVLVLSLLILEYKICPTNIHLFCSLQIEFLLLLERYDPLIKK